MNLPYELLLFGVAFFGLMAVVNFVRSRQTKEKFYYLAAVISSLVVVAWILLVLGQYLLTAILIAIVGVVSVVTFPKTLKLWERELVKFAQEADLSGPLRIRDFFTNQGWGGWLKLALKWGLWKTVSLFYLILVAIMGGTFFILSTFYGFMTIGYVVSHTTITSILVTLMFYQQFKKAWDKRRVQIRSS